MNGKKTFFLFTKGTDVGLDYRGQEEVRVGGGAIAAAANQRAEHFHSECKTLSVLHFY